MVGDLAKHMENAPIAIFAFRRAKHLSATLEALERCPEARDSKIFVFCDGPRGPADEQGVREVRQLIRSRATANMTIVEQPKNVGLAKSIIAAVTQITSEHDRIIVIEDDIVVQPTALTWLNAGLQAYGDDPRVMQVSAYQYRVPEFAQMNEGSFQRFATTWGWATWRRAWEKFDPEATGWRAVVEDPDVSSRFDAGGVYPFSNMLQQQMTGKIDSWGIRWSWSVFRNNGITLMPPRSLVNNIGIDASGTHNTLGPFKRLAAAPPPLAWTNSFPPGLPSRVDVDPLLERAFRAGLRRTNAMRNHRIKKYLARAGFSHFAT